MTLPKFEDQQEQWSSPPVDDVGYIPSSELLTYSDEDLRDLMEKFERTRYQGDRNHEGRWRSALGLDSTQYRTVLDYGCGTGIEALQYAKANNDVWVADIVPENVTLASRVLGLYGYKAPTMVITEDPPFIEPLLKFDVIHCAGALHHIPRPEPVVRRFWEILKPGGELRLMLYSDVAWRNYTGTEPPEDVAGHPQFEKYVRKMDGVGGWADWYDRDRLQSRFGDLFTVDKVEYLMSDKTFLAAILTRIDK